MLSIIFFKNCLHLSLRVLSTLDEYDIFISMNYFGFQMQLLIKNTIQLPTNYLLVLCSENVFVFLIGIQADTLLQKMLNKVSNDWKHVYY